MTAVEPEGIAAEAGDLQMVIEGLAKLENEIAEFETKIAEFDGMSVVSRWESGRILLQKCTRDAADRRMLPKELRQRLNAEPFNLNATEISRRMTLADRFATQEDVLHACKKRGSWRQIIAHELTSHKSEPEAVSDDDAWAERAEKRVAKLLEESGQSDARRDALVGILARALNGVTYPAESQ